jgi:hypothetical protein
VIVGIKACSAKFWKLLRPHSHSCRIGEEVQGQDDTGSRTIIEHLDDELTCAISPDASLNPLADLLDLLFAEDDAQNSLEAISAPSCLLALRKSSLMSTVKVVCGCVFLTRTAKLTSSSLLPSQTDPKSSPLSLTPGRPKSTPV